MSSPDSGVIKVYQLLLEGHSKADILEALPTLFPGADATALVMEAVESFAVIAEEPIGSIMGWCMESARVLYRKCVEVGDFTGALACSKEVSRLALAHKKNAA